MHSITSSGGLSSVLDFERGRVVMWKNNPLDRPDPMPEKGSDTRDQLLLRVGYALTQWERTEESFASLFAQFVLPERPVFPAFRAYGAIASARARSEALKAAAAAFFHADESADLQSKFKTLMGKYQNATARRNEIAHAISVGSYVGHGPSPDDIKFLGFFLYPSMYSQRHRDLYLDPVYRYSADEVLHSNFSSTRCAPTLCA